MINRLINSRYEILEQLGNGAFFQVYKARDKVSGQMVAVKSLRPEYLGDADFYAALVRALPTVSHLSHSNISRQMDILTEPEGIYIISEYVRGINLKERIRRIAPFTLAVTVDFAVAIAEALHQAHQNGVIHGDLRPQNIIISPEGVLKVTDFGMAQALLASPKASAHNLSQFAYYQAPETTSGAPVTPAADIYGLGVILFEMLTGSLPYTGESPLIIATKHQKDPTPSPKAVNSSVPRSMDGIVLKALQKRPEDRYRSVNDMLNDLKMVRDALRFGKSLSWSPVGGLGSVITSEPEKDAVKAPRTNPETVRTKTPSTPSTSNKSDSTFIAEVTPPVEEKTRKNGASIMAYGMYDDRVSPYLKIAIGTVLFILLCTLIIGVPLYLTTFAKPVQKKLPNLVGMVFDQAKTEADSVGVRLIRHDDFNDKYDPNVIFRSDDDPNRPIFPGKTVNVWVSKGSRIVTVPDVTNMTGDDANQLLQQDGLSIGNVNRADNDQTIEGNVISQSPPSGKRVQRNSSVNLIISNGPSMSANSGSSNGNSNGSNSSNTQDNSSSANMNSNNSNLSNLSSPNPDSTGSSSGSSANSTQSDMNTHTYPLRIRLRHDGMGMREVRVEYDDITGTHTLLDGNYNEGDVIHRNVRVTGSTITVRIYYNDDPTPVSEQTINLSGKQ